MSKKTVAVGLAALLVLAGCGGRSHAVNNAAPPSVTSSSSPAGQSGQSGQSVAPILSSAPASSAPAPSKPAPQPVTAGQLLSAPVPSLCQHGSGRLMNGKLPGIPAGQGVVELASVDGYRSHEAMAAFGDLDGDGVSDAAAVLACDRGGVTWPDGIVFYGPGPKILGSFYMDAATGPTRVGITGISISDGTVTVNSRETMQYDALCCTSGRAVVTLHWDGGRIAVGSVLHLPGPMSVTTSQFGAVRLGMTAQQLAALGYRSGAGLGGCLNYAATGKPPVVFDPEHGQAVAVSSSSQDYRTYQGGFDVGDLVSVAQLTKAFPHYRVTSYFRRDFGQGGTGITVTAPDGSASIGFVLAARPNATGLATVTGLRIGTGRHATALEVGC